MIILNIIENFYNCSDFSELDTENPTEKLKKLINSLIKISLSPLPTNKENILKQKKEISKCLRKIVFYFDQVLRQGLKEKDSSKEKINSKFSLSDKTYWKIISENIKTPSVNYITEEYQSQIDENIENSQDDINFIWILISILENSFSEIIKEIYKKGLDTKFYTKDADFIMKKEEILDIVENLSKLTNLFCIDDFSIYKNYKNYKTSNKNKNLEPNGMLELDNLNQPKKETFEKGKKDSSFLIEPEKNFNLNLTDSAKGSSIVNINQNISNSKNQLNTLDKLLSIINKENTYLVEESSGNMSDYHQNIEQMRI